MSQEPITRVTAPQIFYKHPDEVWTDDAQRVLDLTGVLNGATLDDVESITVRVLDGSEDASQYGSATLSAGANASISGATVLYDVNAGYDLTNYAIDIICNLVGGGRIAGVQRVFVRLD